MYTSALSQKKKKECAMENTIVKIRIGESIFILPKQNICFTKVGTLLYEGIECSVG